ncbi:hypothetical protein N7478_000814 [Penicillium angulare]|uniref:uncharacterized protein n=1 Tax=Penicillium angulare TaxID=116970 RepID=UPI00253F89B5|nr:uncharacterized protein N7478_000814 [Penicillium angulare]KAJ5291563.1 hypothetical protein N7478_000814 [Penicillium angulare]
METPDAAFGLLRPMYMAHTSGTVFLLPSLSPAVHFDGNRECGEDVKASGPSPVIVSTVAADQPNLGRRDSNTGCRGSVTFTGLDPNSVDQIMESVDE